MRRLLGLAGLLALPLSAWASVGLDTGDTAWIMTATALVLFMTLPGLALFYGGLVRTKNVLSVLMQCFVICCLSTIIWVTVGYSLAFSGGNGFIGDLSRVMLSGIGEDTLSGTIPESLFAMFQMTFAVITPALVVGGFAERIKFSAMLWFSALWLLAVYIPITHWVWASEGWLFKMGLLDFAGGTVVHVTAGVAALVAAMVLGPRRGFQTTPMLPHNMTMTVTGAAMLWVGWFGFNGGSALSSGGNAAMAILVTHISAAAGALAWSVAEWKRYGKPSALGTVTGMVAGLGTITPASGFVGPGGAILIGLTAGVVCFAMTNILKRVLKIDDSLDVFPVHGVGGILGTLAAGIFASDALGVFSGPGYAEGMAMGSQMSVQTIGVLATAAYTAGVTFVLFKLISVFTGGLRVTGDEELVGLDQVSHNERGYDL
ncbi:ammonium transporter [Polycyclovorans algicola]|uniref:ammonium transporter n=1 Tax=Polycyclovorans algicola TaxID=616992 RepID=UPI0004A724D2|nr:ammonium transporter [Polycyclovorans algicola]